MSKSLTPADVLRQQMSKYRLPHLPMPTTAGGVPSVRAYRRIGDYAIELWLNGRAPARDVAAIIGALHKQAEMLVGEKTLSLQSATGDVQSEHPLGTDGGLATLSPEIVPQDTDDDDRDTVAELPDE